MHYQPTCVTGRIDQLVRILQELSDKRNRFRRFFGQIESFFALQGTSKRHSSLLGYPPLIDLEYIILLENDDCVIIDEHAHYHRVVAHHIGVLRVEHP